MLFSGLTRVAPWIRVTFLFQDAWYFIVCICHILFICFFVDGHLVCFHFLAIVNNAAVTADIQVSVWVPAFSSFGHIPRNGIAGSYVHSMFSFQKNCLLYSFTEVTNTNCLKWWSSGPHSLLYYNKARLFLPFAIKNICQVRENLISS